MKKRIKTSNILLLAAGVVVIILLLITVIFFYDELRFFGQNLEQVGIAKFDGLSG